MPARFVKATQCFIVVTHIFLSAVQRCCNQSFKAMVRTCLFLFNPDLKLHSFIHFQYPLLPELSGSLGPDTSFDYVCLLRRRTHSANSRRTLTRVQISQLFSVFLSDVCVQSGIYLLLGEFGQLCVPLLSCALCSNNPLSL